MASLSRTTLSGRCSPRGAARGPPQATRWGGGWGWSRGAARRLLRGEVSYLSALTTQNLPWSRAGRELSPPSRAVGGCRGGPPATQQQPRLRAVAGVRGRCARRAARRPTLHKGSMALPGLAGSPAAASAAPPSPGTEGFAPFHPQPPSFSSGPHPAGSRAGGPARRIELPAPSSAAAVAAAALTVTLAASAAIYIHAIGFHS